MKNQRVYCAFLLCVSLLGCSTTLEPYRDNQPKLDLQQFFSGRLQASGMVQGYSGEMVRYFRADILAKWQGDQGVLDEIFYFNDGEVQTRCWYLHKDGNRYTGTAGDVVGVASGSTSGNVLHWQYDLQVQVDEQQWQLNMDDWMYLIDENNLLNRTRMKKWGIEVGEVTLHIAKVENTRDAVLSEQCQLPRLPDGE